MKTNLRALQNTPPWEWPEDAGKVLLDVLRGARSAESDFALAVELAGELTVINDDLVDALLAILRRSDESEETRGRAAISLGAVLEQADLDGFGDPDDMPISERTFHTIQKSLQELYRDAGRSRGSAAADPGGSGTRSAGLAQGRGTRRIRQQRRSLEAHRRLRDALRSRIHEADPRSVGQPESRTSTTRPSSRRAIGKWRQPGRTSQSLVASEETDKALLLAAIEAAGSIRPQEAARVLAALMDSDDEDIAEAAHEAVGMAESLLGMDLDEDDEDLD